LTILTDCTLIYPPLSNPFYPYLALPSLTSFLKQNGKSVKQIDLNIEIYDYLFSSEYLEILESELTDKIKFLDSQKNITWKEQEELIQLICLKIALENLKNRSDITKITPEKMKAVFRDINSYRYEDNIPVLLDEWQYFQKLNTILFYHISPIQVPVYDTKSIQRIINNEEFYFYYKVLKEKFLPQILKTNSKFVGISITYDSQVVSALYLGYLLKQANPDIYLCIGGQHFSTISQDIKNFYHEIDFVDSFVIDEGEEAILGILDYLDGEKNIEDIPNLIYMKDNKVIENKKTFFKDINTLPIPEFDKSRLGKYFTAKTVLPYSASKGCYYNKCTFCSFPYISPRYRIKKPELIAKELKFLSEEYNTKLFYFTNEADPPKRVEQIAQELINTKTDVYYHSFCRFDKQVTYDTCKLLGDSGCKVIFFGLESASNRINELMMNKGVDLEKAKEILSYCNELGINTVVSSIIGFPSETLDESISTKNFLEKYSYYKNHVPQPHDFRLPRGTDVEINHEKYGITKIYKNEGNLATVLNNYETVYTKYTKEQKDMTRIKHDSIDYFPHHDCIELLYADYYNGNTPVVFSYNKAFTKPIKTSNTVTRNSNVPFYHYNKYSFDELLKRKEFRMQVINSLYKSGHTYEEMDKIISDSILGNSIKQYESSIFASFSKIQELLKLYK